MIVAVAAAALVVGAVGGVVGSRLADRTPPPATQGPAGPAGQILAQVPLANLKPATTGASGSAQVVRTPPAPGSRSTSPGWRLCGVTSTRCGSSTAR